MLVNSVCRLEIMPEIMSLWLNVTLRLDQIILFRERLDPLHHIGQEISCIGSLNVDMVNGFILDYLHLICVGRCYEKVA